MKRSVDAGKPFFLYFNHSLMHISTIPRPNSRESQAKGTGRTAFLNSTPLKELKVETIPL